MNYQWVLYSLNKFVNVHVKTLFFQSHSICTIWLAKRIEFIRWTFKNGNCLYNMESSCGVTMSLFPPPGRNLIPRELYTYHLDIAWTKTLAPICVWWPSTVRQRYWNFVQSCSICQAQRYTAIPVPIQPWSCLPNSGIAYTWTMPGYFLVTCIWYWSMSILNTYRLQYCPLLLSPSLIITTLDFRSIRTALVTLAAF